MENRRKKKRSGDQPGSLSPHEKKGTEIFKEHRMAKRQGWGKKKLAHEKRIKNRKREKNCAGLKKEPHRSHESETL